MNIEETKKITLTKEDLIAVLCQHFSLDPKKTMARAVNYCGVDGNERFALIVEENRCN